VPTLERLLAGPHPVVAVVSQPDRRRGRGRKTSPSPVTECTLAADIPLLLRPERVGAPDVEHALREAAPDLGVVVAFGQFIPKRIRELPTRGYLLNAHASLLPRLRGAAPIARAILEGEPETGISVMRVEREMDAGAVALVRPTAIGPEENEGELSARLAQLAADAIAEAVDQVAEGRIRWTPQDPSGATLAPKLTRADAQLDFREPAERLVRRVRAMAPRPGATAWLEGEPEARSTSIPAPCAFETACASQRGTAGSNPWFCSARASAPSPRMRFCEDSTSTRGCASTNRPRTFERARLRADVPPFSTPAAAPRAPATHDARQRRPQSRAAGGTTGAGTRGALQRLRGSRTPRGAGT
jgi:methionyl-tRNA formyltransferase